MTPTEISEHAKEAALWRHDNNATVSHAIQHGINLALADADGKHRNIQNKCLEAQGFCLELLDALKDVQRPGEHATDCIERLIAGNLAVESKDKRISELEKQHEVQKALHIQFSKESLEQLQSKDREIERLKAEEAYLRLQRDSLLEMTWMDLPDEPSESTARWKEEFEKGWARKDQLTEANCKLAERSALIRRNNLEIETCGSVINKLNNQITDLQAKLSEAEKRAEWKMEIQKSESEILESLAVDRMATQKYAKEVTAQLSSAQAEIDRLKGEIRSIQYDLANREAELCNHNSSHQ